MNRLSHLEELKTKFPVESIAPFGIVLIVPISEILNACIVLYPVHTKVVSELLKQVQKILEGEGSG